MDVNIKNSKGTEVEVTDRNELLVRVGSNILQDIMNAPVYTQDFTYHVGTLNITEILHTGVVDGITKQVREVITYEDPTATPAKTTKIVKTVL